MNCPLCSVTLAERGYYCQSCAAQVRCKACREMLEPGAAACVECGARISESAHNGPTAATDKAPSGLEPHRNTLSYGENRSNRSFSASLTDTAIQGLGDVLGEFFARRDSVRPASHAPKTIAPALALPTPSTSSNGGAGHPEVVPPPSNAWLVPGDKERVLRLFSANGEVLELKDNRLKAKSQSDFVRKLTYLFLYAHELHGRPLTSHDDLRAVQQTAKVWDANTRKWLAKRVGFTADSENRYKLNTPGKEDAIKALNDALNPEIQDEWNPDKKVPRKLTPRKKAA
jgi:hypothetical protein